MRSLTWLKTVTFIFLLLYTGSLTVGCSTPTQTHPLKISKINATKYPDKVSAFFSIGDNYKRIVSLDGISSSVKILHDEKEVHNYTIYPQRNQKLSNYTILLIDTSYSMHTNGLLSSVKENLKLFIQSMTINDKVMIVSYNTSIYVHAVNSQGQPCFLQNKVDLSKIIDQIQYDTKNTTFYDAIYLTLDLFPTYNKQEQYNIVLFTDLAETHASVVNQFTPKQCINKARTKNVRIFTIVYGDDVEETLHRDIDEISHESYSSLEFLQIRSFFSEISAKVYQENLLYGISTAWFFHPQLKKKSMQHMKSLLLEYANYCISKDANGLYQYPNLSLLPLSMPSTNDVFLFADSLVHLDEKLQTSTSYSDDAFDSCLRQFVHNENHSHNAVFIIDSNCKHIHSQIEKSLQFAIYNGISLSFITIGDTSPGKVFYKSIADKTGGFILQVSPDTPIDDSIDTLVDKIQEGHRIDFSVSYSSSLFNHHAFSILNQDIPSLSDTKYYFSGIINTSFQHSPYFRILLLLLFLILFILLMAFLLLHHTISKRKNQKKLQENLVSAPRKECQNNLSQPENPLHVSTSLTKVLHNKTTLSVSWVCILSGKQKGQSFSIQEQPTTIGCQPSCHICLLDESVSPHHATIFYTVKDGEAMYCIQDMLSSKGVFVNSEKIVKQVALHDNDIIQCGDIIFIFKSLENSRFLNEY